MPSTVNKAYVDRTQGIHMGEKYSNIHITQGAVDWCLGMVLLHYAQLSGNVCPNPVPK